MKATVLVGTGENQAIAFTGVLNEYLEKKGWSVQTYYLNSMKIPPCSGEFDCWLKTPGICRMSGPHRDIAASMIQSGLLVAITPVTWGGFGYDLKKAWDHTIPLVLPFMKLYDGETHHVPRYPQYPDYLAVGLLEKPDQDLERIFETMVRRVVLNYYSKNYDARFLYLDSIAETPSGSLESWFPLRYNSRQAAITPVDLTIAPPSQLAIRPLGRVLLLTGSPNGWTGHSGILGKYLADQLKAKGVEVETGSIYGSFSSETRMHEIATAARSADLLVLTAPLYEDQLPAPVVHGLADIGRLLRDMPGPLAPRLAVLVNCGFPEAVHNDVALAIYRQFTVMNCWEWAGGLEIPGGGMLDGESLESLGRRARRIRQALDLTAVALTRGEPVPVQAFESTRRLSLPSWLYRLVANWGFRWDGRGRRLMAQPYVI